MAAPGAPRNFLAEFDQNLVFTNRLLWGLNQSLDELKARTGYFVAVLKMWPLGYCIAWCLLYVYFMVAEDTVLEFKMAQLWCFCSISQASAKMLNAQLAKGKLLKLMDWCRGIYTEKHPVEYQRIIDDVFQSTNHTISLAVRVNSALIISAVSFYLLLPIYLGDRLTPTPLSWHGETNLDRPAFLAIYFAQSLHALFVAICLSGFDAIFILCVLIMTFRFRAMIGILKLLHNCQDLDGAAQKRVLGYVYRMHMGLLDVVDLFRDYYYMYGLAQLASNLLCNCSNLYILQMVGVNISNVNVLAASIVQVLIVCTFGQQLQNEANAFNDSLAEVDWINMTLENRRILIILMCGSEWKVNIRAGGTYELNMTLFAQIVKAGFTMCAVLKAV